MRISANKEGQPAARDVHFGRDMMHVRLTDGRVISVPLDWFPRLKKAKPAERENCRLIGGGVGINWPDLDEDISVAGLLR